MNANNEGLFYAMSSVSAAFVLSLAVGPLAGKMLGSMFWFFEYRFTVLPVLLTIPVFLLPGWLIPCMIYALEETDTLQSTLRQVGSALRWTEYICTEGSFKRQ